MAGPSDGKKDLAPPAILVSVGNEASQDIAVALTRSARLACGLMPAAKPLRWRVPPNFSCLRPTICPRFFFYLVNKIVFVKCARAKWRVPATAKKIWRYPPIALGLMPAAKPLAGGSLQTFLACVPPFVRVFFILQRRLFYLNELLVYGLPIHIQTSSPLPM